MPAGNVDQLYTTIVGSNSSLAVRGQTKIHPGVVVLLPQEYRGGFPFRKGESEHFESLEFETGARKTCTEPGTGVVVPVLRSILHEAILIGSSASVGYGVHAPYNALPSGLKTTLLADRTGILKAFPMSGNTTNSV